MVYVQAARKTAALMALAGVLSLGVVTLLTEDLSGSATGNVVSPAAQVAGTNWLTFALGLFIGTLVVGTYVFLLRHEAGREE